MILCSAGLLIVCIYDLSESLSKNYSDALHHADKKGPGEIPAPSKPSSFSAVLGVDVAVRVEDVLLGRALVEVLVAFWGLIKGDDRGVDGVGDVGLIVQDAHHQAAVVLLDRALAGEEGVALGPTESEPDLECTLLGLGVCSSWVAGHVEAGDAERTSGTRDGLDLVQDHGRSLFAFPCGGLEAYGVDRAVDLGHAEDLGDLIRELRALADVDGLATERASLREPLLVQVADDDDGRAE